MKILVVCTTDSMIWNFLIPHIHYWQSDGNTVECACSRTGFYFDELQEKYGLKLHMIEFERFPFKLQNLKALISLKKLIKKRGFDTVVSQEPVGGVLGRLAGTWCGCKNVYTAHGFHFYKGAPKINWMIYYPIERFMARQTDVLVTINNEDYNMAKSFHAKHVVKINGIGVDLQKYGNVSRSKKEIRRDLCIPDDKFVILTVAEMIPRKNYKTALRALSKLNEDYLYLICGDGEQMNELQQFAKALGIIQKVRFMGFCKNIDEINVAADVFLFTTYQEGLSIALIEAMASSLPIICSRIRGNTDLVKNKKGGLLYSPTDEEGIADGIRRIMRGEGYDYGGFNHLFVRRFSIQNSVDQFYHAIKL